MHDGLRRFRRLMLLLAGVTVAVLSLWYVRIGERPAAPPVRALWVTRFDYTAPDDVNRIVSNVVAMGFTDLFFQIRGNGTAFYRSRVEPWAFELSGNDVADVGRDPGWDPLQQAIDQAEGTGLRVHAYMNALPGWKGLEDPPPDSGQLWTAHPDWFMVDSLGQKMLPTAGWYAFVNPVLPEVRKHLRDIVQELCRYDIDGIHLDYIRYPHDYHMVADQRYPNAGEEELMRHSEFSYDPVSISEMAALYGGDISRDEIVEYRCDSVTRVVLEISRVMQEERPGNCLLSASVLGNPVEGKYHAYQDSGAWIRRGLVDWAVQMNYNARHFDRYLREIKRAGGKRGFRNAVVVGIYCENEIGEILQQINAVNKSGCRGFALFSYTFLFDDSHQPTEKGQSIANHPAFAVGRD